MREPLLSTPQEYPPRPATCEIDDVWKLLCACMEVDAAKRPSFAEVASKIGEVRQRDPKTKLAGWL